MKKKFITYLCSALTVLMLCSKGNTQVSIRQAEATTDMIQVLNKSARISNLLVIDSVGQNYPGQTGDHNNHLVHLAVFGIELGSDAAKDILKILYSGMQGQQLPNLILAKVNAQGRIAEQREFNSITVKEIVLPELKSDSREPAQAKVSIQAETVVYDNGGSMYNAFGSDKNSRLGSASLFSLEMGSLPAQRVMRISSIKILPSFSPGYLYFSIDIPLADATEWKRWLEGNADLNQPPQALIILRNESAQQQFAVQLSQVEIVSISAMSNSERSASFPKITIGLKTIMPPAIL